MSKSQAILNEIKETLKQAGPIKAVEYQLIARGWVGTVAEVK